MTRLLSFLLLTLLSTSALRADNGDWRVYSAYHNAQQTVYLHNRVYVLSDGGLYSYDPEDSSVETYDKATVLSDFSIYSILASPQTNELVIVYQNGNIDVMDAQGNVYNLPDLKQKPLSDKTLNDVIIDGSMLYVSIASGIVCVNLEKKLFADFYTFGENIRSLALLDGTFYVVTAGKIVKGDTSTNLLDPANWTHVRDLAMLRITKFNNQLYVSNSSTIYMVYDLDHFYLREVTRRTQLHWQLLDDHFYAFNATGGAVEILTDNSVVALEGSDPILHLAYGKGQYWAACGEDGLKGYKMDDTHTMSETVGSIIPNSPQRNYSYHLTMAPNQRLLVAGGAFNYPGVRWAGTLLKYENNTWTTFDEAGPLELVGSESYMNLTDLVQDPLDPEHHWASAARSGLYEFRNYKLVNHYSYDNSPLESILPESANPQNYVRVTALAFDSQNNLWMCNNDLETIVRILLKDGTWTSYHIPEIETFTTFDRIIFDRRGWVWTNSRRSAPHSTAGFLVINPGGNPSNPAGFTHRFYSAFTNQDGRSYSPDLFYCITEDVDGAIWMGNESGIFMSEDPSQVFNDDFHVTQIKVPRNDGSDLADYLLSDVPVKCITIDGGNRKWVGTAGSGVYLLSADGQEQLLHFTVDNSPLISNGIYDIAIDGKTGEVFIATDAGLVSYHGDATDPVTHLDEDLVKVYPNPVRPEYVGPIVITGLAYNTNVKIVNAAGRLVAEGTSVGGEYTWDGRLSSGQRCASGIYYVLSTEESGNKGVVSKFLMVRE